MEKKHNERNDILEILFADRNKAYGAYELRVTYNKRMKRALSGMFLFCLLFTVGSILANAKDKNKKQVYVGPEVQLTKIIEPPPEEIKPPEPKIEQPKTATEILTPPKIVIDELVKDEEIMKPVDDYADVKIGLQKIEGTADVGIVEPPVEVSTGIGKGIKSKDDELENKFISVQIPASFPGGYEEWNRFLQRSLNSDIPTENGAPAGAYTVIVSFLVDTEGKVSDVKAENDPGYGTKDEAVRVIKRGPKWVPANQNGKAVIYRHKQSITFKVTEQ